MNSFIVIHVAIALTSIVLASVTFFKPSMKKLAVSYSLIVGTAASGTVLLTSAPSHMLEGCVVGVAYLAVASTATIATHVRLRQFAKQNI